MTAEKWLRRTAPPNVMDWPAWARRVFLLMLPASAPLLALWWAVWVVGIAFGATFGALIVYPLACVVCVIAAVFMWIAETLGDLWHES